MARSSTWRARLLDRAGAMTLSLIIGAASAVAQTTQAPAPAQQPPTAPAAQPAAQAGPQQAAQPAVATEPPAEAVAPAGDITGLVAPIALYPDPLLALILQASTLPLEVVQADRFLAQRAGDPSLTPDAGWDSSILGLLNYPQLIQSMSEYLDWTQDLGDAVIDRLPEVQDAIAQIRWSAYTSHILVSNDSQNVILDGNYIRIMPAKNDQVSIPTYDPVALMAAIEQPPAGAGEGVQPASATTSEPAPAGTEAASGAAQSSAAAEPSSADTTQPATSDTSEAPAATTGTEAAAPAAAAPAAPATYAAPAPAYAAAPPVVAYSEPQSSFWSSAAPFIGGAAVGGLLGYVIGDDDNNNNNHNNGGNRNNSPNIKIEDSNVVVGGRNGPYRGTGYYGGNGNRNRPGYPPPRYQPYGAGSQQNVQRELQQRRQRASGGRVSPVRQPTRAVAGVPVAPRSGGVTRTTTTTTSTSVRVPRDLGKKQATGPTRTARNEPAATRLPGANTTSSRPGGQVGAKASAPRGGMASNVTSKTRADAASQRGASSRAAAAKRPAAKTTRPAPKRATAQRSGGGGFQMQSGKSAKANSARGKKSRKQGRKGGRSRKKG